MLFTKKNNGNEFDKDENNINKFECKNIKNNKAENLNGTEEKANVNNEKTKEWKNETNDYKDKDSKINNSYNHRYRANIGLTKSFGFSHISHSSYMNFFLHIFL